MRLLLLLLLLALCTASPGDKLNRFKRCRSSCDQKMCQLKPVSCEWQFEPMSSYLYLLNWNCYQDCDYQCQRIITEERILKDKPVVQFHGKWPFRRVWGIQELISTIFSLGNLIPHLLGMKKIIGQIRKESNGQCFLLFVVILVLSVVSCFAWLFSTIFHIRDTKTTEKLDYFLAGLTVLSGFYNTFVRYYRLYLSERLNYFISFTIACLTAYSLHIYRMIVDWGYVYNMKVNITVAVLQNITLYSLCFKLYSQYYNHPESNTKHLNYGENRILFPSFFNKSCKLFSLYPLLLSGIVTFGMSLEIFDFPPIIYDLVDAHSLWHLVTIVPVVFGWYQWLIWDVKENVALDKIKQV